MANEQYEKDSRLIALVKSKPGLYDLGSPYYTINEYKKTAWAEIERALDFPEAKFRWEQLRSQHRKSLNKQKKRSGQASKRKSKWRFSDQMAFMDENISNKKTRISSKEYDENSDCVEENTNSSVTTENNDKIEAEVANTSGKKLFHSSTVPKRKKEDYAMPLENSSSTSTKYILQEKEEEPPAMGQVHPIDIFFSLMAETVKSFSPNDQHYVKTQVFTLVNKIEEKYLTPFPSTYLPPVDQAVISPAANSKPLNTASYFPHLQDDYEEEKYNSESVPT